MMMKNQKKKKSGSDSEKDDKKSGSSSDSEKDEKKEKKEKTPKVKKPKVVLASQQSFSKRYSHLLNNKAFSDVTVKYPSGDTHHGHKTILCSGCETFEKAFESSNHYQFDSEVDDTVAKNIIQFLYNGTLEYSDPSALVQFMLLANKLKVKNMGEFKVPAKVYLNGVITYIEKDLSSRVSEFDSLCESVDFKKNGKRRFNKIIFKKKMVTKKFNILKSYYFKGYGRFRWRRIKRFRWFKK